MTRSPVASPVAGRRGFSAFIVLSFMASLAAHDAAAVTGSAIAAVGSADPSGIQEELAAVDVSSPPVSGAPSVVFMGVELGGLPGDTTFSFIHQEVKALVGGAVSTLRSNGMELGKKLPGSTSLSGGVSLATVEAGGAVSAATGVVATVSLGARIPAAPGLGVKFNWAQVF